MYCKFESSAETFEELDEIYASHSIAAGHRADYNFYDSGMKLKWKSR
jgi:hypothetical protein